MEIVCMALDAEWVVSYFIRLRSAPAANVEKGFKLCFSVPEATSFYVGFLACTPSRIGDWLNITHSHESRGRHSNHGGVRCVRKAAIRSTYGSVLSPTAHQHESCLRLGPLSCMFLSFLSTRDGILVIYEQHVYSPWRGVRERARTFVAVRKHANLALAQKDVFGRHSHNAVLFLRQCMQDHACTCGHRHTRTQRNSNKLTITRMQMVCIHNIYI